MATDPSALMAWAYPWHAWLDAAIGREIARTRARYELTLDEYRGVYVSDEQVDRLLESGEQVPRSESPRPAVVPGTPLATIADAFALGDAAIAALFSVMALEFDAKYEALYAYLNDDATRRYATVELCRRLTSVPRAELEPDAPLLAEGLLVATPAHAAAPWRSAALSLAGALRTFVFGAPLAAVSDARASGSQDVPRVAAVLSTGQRHELRHRRCPARRASGDGARDRRPCRSCADRSARSRRRRSPGSVDRGAVARCHGRRRSRRTRAGVGTHRRDGTRASLVHGPQR